MNAISSSIVKSSLKFAPKGSHRRIKPILPVESVGLDKGEGGVQPVQLIRDTDLGSADTATQANDQLRNSLTITAPSSTVQGPAFVEWNVFCGLDATTTYTSGDRPTELRSDLSYQVGRSGKSDLKSGMRTGSEKPCTGDQLQRSANIKNAVGPEHMIEECTTFSKDAIDQSSMQEQDVQSEWNIGSLVADSSSARPLDDGPVVEQVTLEPVAFTLTIKQKSTPRLRNQKAASPLLQEVSATTPMALLCKDLNFGRRSSKFSEFERIERQRRTRHSKTVHPDVARNLEMFEQTNDGEDNDQIAGRISAAVYESRSQKDGSGSDDSDMSDGRGEGSDLTMAASGTARMRIRDGKLIVDEASLQVDRTARDVVDSGEVDYVDENPLERRVNSRSFSKRLKTERWDALSTASFYEALSQWGTDFEMISRMFFNRTRRQIKAKYNNEERKNPGQITRALKFKKPIGNVKESRIDTDHEDINEYSKITDIAFRPICELEEDLIKLRQVYEQERQEAIREAESRNLTAASVAMIPAKNSKSRKRGFLEQGIEIVGTLEEVAQEEAAAAAVKAGPDYDSE